jgi:hypothetical protein
MSCCRQAYAQPLVDVMIELMTRKVITVGKLHMCIMQRYFDDYKTHAESTLTAVIAQKYADAARSHGNRSTHTAANFD